MAGPELPSFHGIIGRSAPMRALFKRIDRVAPIDAPVLILGETGTGKELIARAIQQRSRRNERRFEIVNCGALTRELLLSELFGHERGAFTGAVARKEGLLATADGGTMFLDEVGELPADAQAMLLRFLQSGEVRPVGSMRTPRLDVRVISATNRDLHAAIADGAFREDLYYRLWDVVLEVPPLRERPEDIALLVEHVRVRVNVRYGFAITPVGAEVLALLEAAPWRGNVRELEKVLTEAMILRGVGRLAGEDLRLADDRPRAKRRVAHADSRGRPGPPLFVNSRRQVALRIASEQGSVTRRALSRVCAISRETARQELAALVHLGYLRRVGEGRNTEYVLR